MASDDLVTLDEVITVLKFDESGDDDGRLNLLIAAASKSILRFLKSTGDEYRDTDGDVVPGNVPEDIRTATIMFVGIMEQNPDGNDSAIYKADWLPDPVRSLLHSRREPTLA